jgi:hypothetical protein
MALKEFVRSFSRNTRGEQALIVQLKSVVKLWPTERAQLSSLSSALEGLLAPEFDRMDLLNGVSKVAKVRKVDITAEAGTVEFLDSEGCPQRAIFEKDARGEWRLHSLKFECPACFGAGVNNGATCTLCGGAGWGAV